MQIKLKTIFDDIIVPDDTEYLLEVMDLLENPLVQSMKDFVQHGATSCFKHSVSVSYFSYLACKQHGLNARSAARAGLLHDFFLYDWHLHFEKTGDRFHGLSHPKIALENAKKTFELTELEKEIISKHMWPLTVVPPKSPEAYIVIYYDKVCSFKETFGMKVLPEADNEFSSGNEKTPINP